MSPRRHAWCDTVKCRFIIEFTPKYSCVFWWHNPTETSRRLVLNEAQAPVKIPNSIDPSRPSSDGINRQQIVQWFWSSSAVSCRVSRRICCEGGATGRPPALSRVGSNLSCFVCLKSTGLSVAAVDFRLSSEVDTSPLFLSSLTRARLFPSGGAFVSSPGSYDSLG